MTQLTATPAQYAGRTTDLLMLDDWAASGDALTLQTLVKRGQSGAEITGIEKVIQRFLIELLTERGSMPYQASRGSTFMVDARIGAWRTPADVTSSFVLAVAQVKATLFALEQPSDPDDERFRDAQVLNVAVTNDSVTLQISFTTAAGTSRVVYFPLRTSYL